VSDGGRIILYIVPPGGPDLGGYTPYLGIRTPDHPVSAEGVEVVLSPSGLSTAGRSSAELRRGFLPPQYLQQKRL